MKIICPVCGVEGIYEERGNSKRVIHYKGFIDNKRVYEKHSLGINPMGISGNKSIETKRSALGINKPKASSISINKSSGRVAQHGLDAVTIGNHAKSTSLLSWGSRVQIPPRPPLGQ